MAVRNLKNGSKEVYKDLQPSRQVEPSPLLDVKFFFFFTGNFDGIWISPIARALQF